MISASLAGCTSEDDVGDMNGENGGTTIINEYVNETYEVINYTYIQPPIIYQHSWVSCTSGYNNNNNSSSNEINCIGHDFAATDADGNITEFGVDVNSDFIIDIYITGNTSLPQDIIINNTSLENTQWHPYGSMCIMAWNIIAIDNSGEMTVQMLYPYLHVSNLPDGFCNSQNEQQTGNETTGNETTELPSGKISIITMWVADQTDCDGDDDGDDTGPDNADKCITVVFEMEAGSEPVEESNVIWTIICANNGGTAMTTIWGDFATADVGFESSGTDTVNVDGSAKANTTLYPGEVYMIDLKVETDDTDGTTAAAEGPTAAECSPQIGEEHTLIISVEGGGTTYETLSYTSITEGDSVV